jgi:hypothetical protein
MSVQRSDEGHEGTMVVPVLRVPIDLPMVGVQAGLNGQQLGWLGEDAASWLKGTVLYNKPYHDIRAVNSNIQDLQQELKNTLKHMSMLSSSKFYFQTDVFEKEMNKIMQYYYSLQNIYRHVIEHDYGSNTDGEQFVRVLNSHTPRNSNDSRRQQVTVQPASISKPSTTLPVLFYKRQRSSNFTQNERLWIGFHEPTPIGFKPVYYAHTKNKCLYHVWIPDKYGDDLLIVPEFERRYIQDGQSLTGYHQPRPAVGLTIIEKN